MVSSLIDRVRHALPRGAELLSNPPEVAHADLLVQTGAGFAFFRVVQPREDLVASWRTVQNEIARYLSRLSQDGHRQGAYLALLVEGPRDPVVLQRIAANPYVCRKVVLPSDSLNIEQMVDDLPFFPLPDRVQTTIRRPPVDPLVVARGTGITRFFVEHLLENRGAERIRTDLLAGTYNAVPEAVPAMARPTGPGREAGLADRLFVRKLHVQGFRNYGGDGKTIPLTGDLVVVYGRNGTGKTSLCEALEWGLTGKSHRVERVRDKEQQQGVHRSPLLHLLDGDQGAEVDIWLEGPKPLHLRRVLTQDHESRHLNAREVAERDILRAVSLLTDDETIPRFGDVLRDVMRHCHFLSQETIQQFLGNDPKERYEAYTYMVGTQNLLRLIEKGTRVTKLLEAEAADHRRAVTQIGGLIDERLQRKKERAEALESAGVERLPDEATLTAQTNVLTRSATLVGMVLEVPEMPTVKRARVAAQTLIQTAPVRIHALGQEIARLERLDQEAQAMPEVLARRQELLIQLQAYAAAEQERMEVADTRESERTSAARALRDGAEELTEAQRRLEQVNRFLALQDDSLLLEGEMIGTEDDLASLEEERTQLLESLRRLRADQRELQGRLQSLRSETESRVARSAQLQRLGQRLAEWRELAAEQERLQGRRVRLRTESQSLSERLVERRRQWQETRAVVEQRATALSEARRLVQRRQELLAELKGHLASGEAECPFCGHGWETHKQLLAGVQAMLQRLPDGLREAQEAHDEALSRRAELTDALAVGELKLGATQTELGTCEGRLQELHDLLRQADERIAPFFPQRTAASLSPEAIQPVLAHLQDEARLAAERAATAEESLATVSDAISTVESQEQALLVPIQQKNERLSHLRRHLEQIEGALSALGLEFATREEARSELGLRQAEFEAARSRMSEARRALEATQAQADEAHRALAVLRGERTAVQDEFQAITRRLQTFEAELQQAAISGEDPATLRAQIAAQQKRLGHRVAHLTELISVGERLLAQAHACEILLAIQEIDRDVERLRADQARVRAAEVKTAHYLERVQKLLKQAADLRAAEERERLDGYVAMIQVLYQRLCSHPYFGPLSLEIDSKAQQLYVRFEPESGKAAAVNRYFSMAQANAVALAIFLGTALLQSWSQLGVICIDDPVQHMDDMNTYAFLDLLRTMVESGRQIIITTASEDLYRTMVARFAPLNRKGQTPFQAFRLVGVTPQGPEIVHDLPGEGP